MSLFDKLKAGVKRRIVEDKRKRTEEKGFKKLLEPKINLAKRQAYAKEIIDLAGKKAQLKARIDAGVIKPKPIRYTDPFASGNALSSNSLMGSMLGTPNVKHKSKKKKNKQPVVRQRDEFNEMFWKL